MLRSLLSVVLFSLIGITASAQYASDWNPDADGDNTIGVNDLLALLSVFEETDADNDGIFDSQDDCVGVLDACGVCNGPGPTVLVGDSLVCPVYGCTDNLASNFSASANTDDGTCTYGPAQCGGQSTVTFDGHTYNLVGIGNQCWFKENLRSDNYRNGDVIPGNLSDSQWTSTSAGAQAVYGEGTSTVYSGSGDEVANLSTYGRLYNWYAVNDARGLCPTGWQVPSDEEWMSLEMALGMTSTQVNGTGWRGTNQGSQLKSSPSDTPAWNGNNSSGFSAIAGGHRDSSISGSFYAMGSAGNYWSSSADFEFAFSRNFAGNKNDVFRGSGDKSHGISVRCLLGANGSCLDPDNDGVCAENEVSGCTDNNATNFNPSATEEDGSCVMPGPIQCGGQSTVTFDGHTYNLVGIGTQCWFKENLRSDNYRNGDSIPGNLDGSQWTSTAKGAQAVYGEGNSTVYDGSNNDTSNLESFGRLYNWHAVNDARGLCPVGFHAPSVSDWAELQISLGIEPSQVFQGGFRGTNQGEFMKSSPTDWPAWDGTNSSAFSALPGGYRNSVDGGFSGEGQHTGLWATTFEGFTGSGVAYGWRLGLATGIGGIYLGGNDQHDGFSVRCLRDEGVVCLDPDNDGVCAENEVSGCTDSNATNFNPSATEDDGSCVMPGPAQCGGASTVTFDGHTYDLVAIGDQCWFKENLRSDNFRNGDEIPGNLNDGEWASTVSGAQAVYNNDPANLLIYGRLYNWHAVDDARGVCPSGFHVPSDEEWMMLEMSLGMTSAQANGIGWRGTDQGLQMKSATTDSPPWNGTNSAMFNALPSGFRHMSDGTFGNIGFDVHLWSFPMAGAGAWVRILNSDSSNVGRFIGEGGYGFSVRCLKD